MAGGSKQANLLLFVKGASMGCCYNCRYWDLRSCLLGWHFTGRGLRDLNIQLKFMGKVRRGVACCSDFKSIRIAESGLRCALPALCSRGAAAGRFMLVKKDHISK
jgi:hypothetical protein